MNTVSRIALSVLLFAFILACLTGCSDDNDGNNISDNVDAIVNITVQELDRIPEINVNIPDSNPCYSPFCK